MTGVAAGKRRMMLRRRMARKQKAPGTDAGERTKIRVSRSRCIKAHSFSKPARGARKKKRTGRESRSFAAFAPFLFAVKVRYL